MGSFSGTNYRLIPSVAAHDLSRGSLAGRVHRRVRRLGSKWMIDRRYRGIRSCLQFAHVDAGAAPRPDRRELVDSLELVAKQEQLPALRPADGARETRNVGLDSMGNLAAVEHSHHRSGGRALHASVRKGVSRLGPDTARVVNADAIGPKALCPGATP